MEALFLLLMESTKSKINIENDLDFTNKITTRRNLELKKKPEMNYLNDLNYTNKITTRRNLELKKKPEMNYLCSDENESESNFGFETFDLFIGKLYD